MCSCTDVCTGYVQEAVVVLLAAGASMRLPLRERVNGRPSDGSQRESGETTAHRTRFAAAVAAVENVVQQKVTADGNRMRSLRRFVGAEGFGALSIGLA